MAYCTVQDVYLTLSEDEVKAMLRHGNTPEANLESKLENYIEMVSSDMDFFLYSSGYQLPLTQQPPGIKHICVCMVLQVLFGMTSQPMPEFLESLLNNGIGMLKALRTKEAQAYPLDTNVENGAGGNTFELNLSYPDQNPRIFPMSKLRGTMM